jgi:RNA recognition motif-containing protein
MDLFVGIIPLNISDIDLKSLFEIYATVYSAKIIKDKKTGLSRGFGFVSIPSQEEALLAMSKINGQYIENIRVCVRKSYDKKDLPRRSR